MAVYRETRPREQTRAFVTAVAGFTGVPAHLINTEQTVLEWDHTGGRIMINIEVPATLAELQRIIQAGQRS